MRIKFLDRDIKSTIQAVSCVKAFSDNIHVVLTLTLIMITRGRMRPQLGGERGWVFFYILVGKKFDYAQMLKYIVLPICKHLDICQFSIV